MQERDRIWVFLIHVHLIVGKSWKHKTDVQCNNTLNGNSSLVYSRSSLYFFVKFTEFTHRYTYASYIKIRAKNQWFS